MIGDCTGDGSMRLLKLFCLCVWVLMVFFSPGQAQGENRLVLVLTADGALTPAMKEYLSRGLEIAERRQAEALIFQLNTPGGSVDLMTDMVEVIRASRVPVIVYVAPRGAIAGSAGTVITLAGHAAAMAPETAIGAASPVGSQGEDLGETMQAKSKNILKATVRSLAERRGEEAVGLAEKTIEEAEAVSATEALEIGLIDFIARDIDHLLSQLDGFEVTTIAGKQTLQTKDAEVQHVDLLFIERLLGVLTNPTIVFLLLTVGVQSILIELSSPGGWVAGFIGVVCLSLAAYGLGVLPVNWFGIIFLITAFVLFILDIKAPTHGALTAAGVISLIIGSLVLFNTPEIPSFQRVPVPLIVGTSIASGLLFFTVVMFAVRAQRTPVRMGIESMVGRVGVARSDLRPRGLVQLGGEQWSVELAPDEEPLERGERVEVVAVQGLKLIVRKYGE
jgi:membrane-bound serine protease (ClpP class)